MFKDNAQPHKTKERRLKSYFKSQKLKIMQFGIDSMTMCQIEM
jgi:hypothetical protein